jgi:hypothetical protein
MGGGGMIDHRDREQRSSDRLETFLSGGKPEQVVGPLSITAASLGTPDDWAHSALSYLSCMLFGTQGGTLGGTIEVSAAAVGVALGYVERLEIEAGIIPTPGEPQ